jgi:hypothetical protein
LARFLLDEDLPPAAARIARSLGIDVISSHECNRNGLPDEAQLRLAAEERRCLVTRNRDDFSAQTRVFFENGWTHAGVLIVPRSLPSRESARIAHALAAYSRQFTEDVPDYTIAYLRPAAAD